ncbi:MAG: hypothetical protein BWY84_00631 [Candidatus Aerophobetes bacterium ADurb.Bin490]|nr:MAG: hypothetical protein BWY84_00631 [Candidatus Aerophobetes bacterium ADurb.Bin490]
MLLEGSTIALTIEPDAGAFSTQTFSVSPGASPPLYA